MKKVFIMLVFIINLYPQSGFFYISYRSVLDNSILKTEKFNISRVMVAPEKLSPLTSFRLFTEKEGDLNVPRFFKNNQDTITRELFKEGIFISDSVNIKEKSQSNRSVLTLPPTIVSVSVKDNFVNITLYK